MENASTDAGGSEGRRAMGIQVQVCVCLTVYIAQEEGSEDGR